MMLKRWKLEKGAQWPGYPMGWSKPEFYPFKWMAHYMAWEYKTMNLFPGKLETRITREL